MTRTTRGLKNIKVRPQYTAKTGRRIDKEAKAMSSLYLVRKKEKMMKRLKRKECLGEVGKQEEIDNRAN
jgi:hypothetical protein